MMLCAENAIRTLAMEGHVGFDSLPDQQVNKALQKGFVFNVLCVGETGIGKSTLMDSLFNTTFDSEPSTHDLESVTLTSQTYDLWEKNVQMKLTIVDTVGYGDQVNKEDSFSSIIKYIDQQFEAYLHEELRIERCLAVYQDTRVHVCLYFITPTGHGLKSIDLECMHKLHKKVNIIPIIAKADAISKAELKVLKGKIMDEITANEIQIYRFPTDDETIAETNSAMNAQLPFAVVGSREFCKVGNKMMRARQYPWGTVQVENEAHCDTAKLREMLIRTNMDDLREQTHMLHYETYRKSRLIQMEFADTNETCENESISFQEACEVRMLRLFQEFVQKEEQLQDNFALRVQKKETELRKQETERQQRFDHFREEHTNEMMLLEDVRRQLDEEFAEFRKLTEFHESKGSPTKQQSSSSVFHNSFSLGSLKGKKK